MKINLISVDNGVGLTQDVNIIRTILNKHTCTFVDVKTAKVAQKADINIFFEILNHALYPFAPVNLFFPNPEWFWFKKQLTGIDLVLCKTLDAQNIFNRLGCRTVYTSFTSRDMYQKTGKSKLYLHLAGRSTNKGTEEVFKAWNRSDLPDMALVMSDHHERYHIHSPNIKTIFGRLSEKDLKHLINKAYFHICPSQYEGFGHYIWEGKSAGGIVITTDGPPMDDFVIDSVDGFLVPVLRRSRQQLGILQHISVAGLVKVVEKTKRLSDKELTEMSLASRYSWEQNDRFFKEILVKIIESVREW